MKWPWTLPERDLTERIARAREVRTQAQCLLERLQQAIGNTEAALGGGDSDGLRGGGTEGDQR